VLPVDASDVRLFLHVLAATVWVGGQLTLAGLVPGLRAISPEAPRAVARRFNRIAWPAFAALVVTGIWNVAEIDVGDRSTDYQVTLFVKLMVVALSGVAAFAHGVARDRAQLAVWGAVAGLSALVALFLGVQLGGS
jgi:putative copper export protein